VGQLRTVKVAEELLLNETLRTPPGLALPVFQLTVQLVSVAVASCKFNPAPPALQVFPLTVQPVSVSVPCPRVPPPPFALLPEIVLLLMLSTPKLSMPPPAPKPEAVLPEITQLVTVKLPEFNIPPPLPLPAVLPLVIVRPEIL